MKLHQSTHSNSRNFDHNPKFYCLALSSSSLAAVIIALGGTSALAQITIQSSGTLSGTIQLPNNNPNFNKSITRVDTDDTGTYSRNVGTKNNPNYVPIYKSNYVKVETRSDGSLHYFVDFRGIPIISFNGVLNSPVLSGGNLTPYKYQGQVAGTTFQGVVQDEFNLTKALYTGIVTDPKTGNQYQGTFEVSGYGPRYSDRNGGATPTVFDFKSDLPGSPTVKSLQMTNSPIGKLTIKIPATATLITPTPVVTTPTPTPVVTTPTPTPVVTTPTPTPVVTTPTPTPVVSGGSTPIPTIVDSGSAITTAPIVDSGSAITVAPIVDSGSAITTAPTTTNYTSGSNSPSLSTAPNIEFSSGNSPTVNQVVANSTTLAEAACSKNFDNSCIKPSSPKQAIGPRSRVLVR